MKQDFLFELGCEELPSLSVWPLAQSLTNNFLSYLDKAGLTYQSVQTFATPRRLGILINSLDEQQPTQKLFRKGPALNAAHDASGNPTKALLGFAKSCGVEVEALTIKKEEKGEWFVYETQTPGEKTKDLIPNFLVKSLEDLPIPKPMRWGAGDIEFARPVHWAVLLYGTDYLSCEILGVKTNRITFGHRFHHPQAIEIDHPKNYETLLKKACVIANFSTRRKMIIEQVESLAIRYQAQAIIPDPLLDEVTSIVEWPQALMVSFNSRFLEVPAKVLIASMQTHQKCFALQSSEGHLLPYFIAVANIKSNDEQLVIKGNEKVMQARLSDADFFFQQDSSKSLEFYIPLTEKVIFQEKLGTLKEKSNRIASFLKKLCVPLSLNEAFAHRAAELSKCDLMTGMVNEFPELEGYMGYCYALSSNESQEVALALDEQYMPRFAQDELPSSSVGLALSLADRMDTMVGIFGIGQKPTGTKDPFKLRRHALAIARILIRVQKNLNIDELITHAIDHYGKKISANLSLHDEIKAFILERLQSFYQNQDVNIDLFLAVKARQPSDLFDFDKRLHALREFIKLDEAQALSAASKRVNNILHQSESLTEKELVINPKLLEEGPEQALFEALFEVEETIKPLYASVDYQSILFKLASLRNPIDSFFDKVMVLVDDPLLRTNRLRLLMRMKYTLEGVADISLLQL